jgi:Flp pilus assembly protein TadG
LAKLKQFKTNISGNFGIIFALTAMPILLAIGMAIDYSVAINAKTKLDSAADTATLASVTAASNTLKNYIEGESNNSLTASAVLAGEAAGQKIFDATASQISNINKPISKVKVSINGLVINSTLSYNADAVNSFSPIININSFPLSNSVSAQSQIDGYLDIYIAIDNSGSMGIGATDEIIAEMSKPVVLEKVLDINGNPILNPDGTPKEINIGGIGCAFGCHIPDWEGWGSVGNTTYDKAKEKGFIMKIDVVRNAISSMLAQAKALRKSPDQFRFTIFTFSNTLKTLQATTTDYDALNLSLSNLSITQEGGGTNLQHSIGSQLPAIMPISGSGKNATDRITKVIIVTDGIEDGQKIISAIPENLIADTNMSPWYGNGQPSWAWVTSGPQAPVQAVNPAICDNIKNIGATVYVLAAKYVYYPEITNNLDKTLGKCANSNQFYFANSPTDIHNAAINIFRDIVSYTRLTQ